MLLILTFCTLFFSACQSQNKEMSLLDNITNISISESNGYGGVNESYSISINQADAISDFEEIFKNAQGIHQDFDLINEKPDYDILVRYENDDTQGLHLLLGSKGEKSIIMFIGHEKIGYTISSEDTNRLRKLLEI
jgi:hypothetical protein